MAAATLFQGTEHAVLYSKFRQAPPPQFISYIIDYLKKQKAGPYKLAIDLGCGSGQSTTVLAPYFEHVCGLDVSDAQIEMAKKDRALPNVEYKVSACETLPFPDSSVDLVTLCESIHYFDCNQLFKEVERVLTPNGVIAAYGYWIPKPKVEDKGKNEKIDHLISQYLIEEQLEDYWAKEVSIVKRHYVDLHLPFKNAHRQSFVRVTHSTLPEYLSYMTTWSSYQKLKNKDPAKAAEIVDHVRKELLNILKENKPEEEVNFPLHSDNFMVIGHK